MVDTSSSSWLFGHCWSIVGIFFVLLLYHKHYGTDWCCHSTAPGSLDQSWAWADVCVESSMFFLCLHGLPMGSPGSSSHSIGWIGYCEWSLGMKRWGDVSRCAFCPFLNPSHRICNPGIGSGSTATLTRVKPLLKIYSRDERFCGLYHQYSVQCHKANRAACVFDIKRRRDSEVSGGTSSWWVYLLIHVQSLRFHRFTKC